MLLCSSRHDIIIKQERDEGGMKRENIVSVNENILQAGLYKEEERVTTQNSTTVHSPDRRGENCLLFVVRPFHVSV